MTLRKPSMPPVEREFSFSDADFEFLATLANRMTGIVLAQAKRDMVYGRLARRLRALQLSDFRSYCVLLQSPEGESELPHLVNAITTNLTGFFRESHHFEHLREQALEWAGSGKRRLRLWSAACSSGMEPYSMAMALKDAIPQIASWDARILATDIDSTMVETGMTGEYNASDTDPVPARYQSMLATPTATNRIRMRDDLKELIRFRQLNLLHTWPISGKFDAVFCRNVVIYFDKATKEKLFDRLADCMVPNGWLYIGHSENLHGVSDRFELVGRTIYRRIK